MKLLTTSMARAIWFFHISDLNPRGRDVERNVLAEIGKKYSFLKVPSVEEMIEAHSKNQPFVLKHGSFQNVEIVALTVYRDAVFADTRSSTHDSESFLVNALEWLASELGLLDYKTIAIRKYYVSEMYVSLNKSLNMINPKFVQFSKMLQEKIKTPYKNLHFEAASLGFWIDPDIKHAHVPFRLERQVDVGFEEGRYYSIAPLETEEHLKALEMLEEMMA